MPDVAATDIFFLDQQLGNSVREKVAKVCFIPAMTHILANNHIGHSHHYIALPFVQILQKLTEVDWILPLLSGLYKPRIESIFVFQNAI